MQDTHAIELIKVLEQIAIQLKKIHEEIHTFSQGSGRSVEAIASLAETGINAVQKETDAPDAEPKPGGTFQVVGRILG